MLGSEGTLPRNWEKSYCIFCGRSQTFRRHQDLQYGHSGFFPWPQQLAEKWVTLQRDEATNGFLKRCLAGPTFWEVCKLAPFRVLRWFVSATDANAILKRGDAQFKTQDLTLFLFVPLLQPSSYLDTGTQVQVKWVNC